MARMTPAVQGEILRWYEDGHEQQLAVDSPAWYRWLQDASLFAFVAESGSFTARKETKPHGATYWKAYRKREGRLSRAYLGKSEQLTLEHLNAVAALLARRAEGEETPPMQGTNETLPLHAASSDQAAVPEPLRHEGDVVNHPASNLPVPLTSLIGREQEQAAVGGLLQRPEVRLVTLTGTGGIGKTRLALQVATDLLADFADGVCFVSLAPVSDPDLVVPTIAQTLGLKEIPGQPLLALLKTSLSEKHLLFLLDNFEQVLAAASQLADLLVACPHLKLLVTSRAVLHLRGEHEFPVPPLALPDLTQLPESETLAQVAAVALFLQRAWASNPNLQLTATNTRAIAEICVQVDGLPLAIELAAARSKLLPPQGLLARLGQRLALLTSGAQDAPARQQTLRNTIAWSYNLLTQEEQQLFRRLAVFVGGCTLQAVETLCTSLEDGRGAEWTLDGVASLIDKSLLQQTEQEGEEPRLLMLETIREFGLECLAAHGEVEATRQAHANYYLLLTEAAEPHLIRAEQGHWFDRFERDHDNLRAALRWFIESEESERALRLSHALSWFWLRRGHLREGRQWLQRALTTSVQASTPMRAWACYDAGRLAFFQDDFVEGETCSEMALTLFRKLGDQRGMALCLRRLGELARTRHNFIAARSLLEESLAILRETDNKGSLAYTLSTLAPTLNQQGEYSRARIQAEESLALFREVNNPGGRAYALRYFAEAIFFQGEYATAQAVAMEGLTTSRELGDKWQIASSLHLLGQLALHQHEQARAQSLLTESLESYRELGSRWSSAKVLALLASIAAFEQDEAHACALIEQSLTILKEVEDQELLAAFLEELGMEVVVQGGPTWAAQLWGAAEHLREVIGAPFSLVEYPTYERAVSLARLHLGEKAFTTAWEEGRTMSLEQVLAAQGPVTMLAHIPAEPSTAPPVPKASTYPDRLTAREVEVLRLVAQGLTDPQVANQLVISPHTVNSHLKAIYGKLGISSRSAATRYAIEHHLL